MIICTHWHVDYMSGSLGSAADFVPLYSFHIFEQISVAAISTELVNTYLYNILLLFFYISVADIG